MNGYENLIAQCGDVWTIWRDAGKELVASVMATVVVEPVEWPEMHYGKMHPSKEFGGDFFGEEFGARLARLPKTADKIAVIPVRGIITQRTNWGTSTESLGASLADAVANPEVGVIVLDIDSPGGSVLGTPELGTKIRETNEKKPVVAVANSFVASGAYWLASAAGQLAVAPSGQVGSIGVFVMHVDASKLLDDMGVKITFVHAGKHKVEGNPMEPLSDEARETFQGRIDTYYGMFVSAVAAGRGVSKTEVLDNYGQGRMFTAEAAKAAGMVDRVATLEEVLSGIVKPKTGTPRRDGANRRMRLAEH